MPQMGIRPNRLLHIATKLMGEKKPPFSGYISMGVILPHPFNILQKKIWCNILFRIVLLAAARLAGLWSGVLDAIYEARIRFRLSGALAPYRRHFSRLGNNGAMLRPISHKAAALVE